MSNIEGSTSAIPYQYPSGHLGHLTPEQTKHFIAFKQLCAERGLYKPKTGDTPASHGDTTLLRYLRARRFDKEAAYEQFKKTEQWRSDVKLDDLYETIDVKEYDDTRKLYPMWTGRRDKRGIPVYVFEVANLNSKAISAYEQAKSLKASNVERKAPVKMLRLFALYENLVRFVLPLCAAMSDRPNAETPITQSSNIVDITGVGLKQFWDLKSHLQDSSGLATAYYPETLDRIFIIGAPSFFPTVWSWIKRYFDPITVSKIFVLGPGEVFSTLSQYMEVENIPKKYGGQLDFSFGDMPAVDPAIEAAIKWRAGPVDGVGSRIPIGPIRWERGEKDEMMGFAVGSTNETPRREVLGWVDKPFDEVFYRTVKE